MLGCLVFVREKSTYSFLLLLNIVEDRLVGRLLEATLVTCLWIVLIPSAQALRTKVESIPEGFMHTCQILTSHEDLAGVSFGREQKCSFQLAW